MTGPQRLVLDANLPAVWADEVLRERRGSLSAPALRDLTLLATDDPDAAEDAYVARLEEDLRSGKTSE